MHAPRRRTPPTRAVDGADAGGPGRTRTDASFDTAAAFDAHAGALLGFAVNALERLALVEAFARLSDAHREAVVAVHLHGRTYRELAEATGVPVATWRTRAYHALRALRGHLEQTEEHDARA